MKAQYARQMKAELTSWRTYRRTRPYRIRTPELRRYYSVQVTDLFQTHHLLDGEAGVSCVEGSCYASWKWQSQDPKSVSELSTTLCISFPPNLNLITRTICCWHSVANKPSDSPRVNDFHMQETIHHQKQIVSQSCLTAKKKWKILTCFNLINIDLMTSLCLALMRHPNKSAWSEKSCSSHRDIADMTYSTL